MVFASVTSDHGTPTRSAVHAEERKSSGEGCFQLVREKIDGSMQFRGNYRAVSRRSIIGEATIPMQKVARTRRRLRVGTQWWLVCVGGVMSSLKARQPLVSYRYFTFPRCTINSCYPAGRFEPTLYHIL